MSETSTMCAVNTDRVSEHPALEETLSEVHSVGAEDVAITMDTFTPVTPTRKQPEKSSCETATSENVVSSIYESLNDIKPAKALQTQRKIDSNLDELLRRSGAVRDVLDMLRNEAHFPRVDLSFQDLSFSVPMRVKNQDGKEVLQRKDILSPISGSITSGSLVCIMGPSGCGKSTLIDILSQKKTLPYSGTIKINGHAPDKYYTRTSSYVPQFDYGSGLDTVRESATFASRLKADYSFSEPDGREALRQKHVDFLLEMLGLTGVSESLVGDGQTRGISGGQRRRLTLLRGLVTCPSIAYLDEPTSGLSSTDAELCIKALSNLAKLTGTTFITVLHQPKQSVFDMFDHLILLSEGQTAYNGPVSEVQRYFTDLGHPVPPLTSLPDHILDVVTPGLAGSDLNRFVAYQKSYTMPTIEAKIAGTKPGTSLQSFITEGNTSNARPQSLYTTSRFQQYLLLQKRELVQFSRGINDLLTILGNSIVMGLFIGCLYFDTYDPEMQGAKTVYQFAYIFFLLIVVSLAAVSVVPNLMLSRISYQNERAEGLYDILPWMLAKFITLYLSMATCGILVILMCSYWLAGFPALYFLYVYAIVLVSYFAMESIISFFACAASTVAMGTSIAGALIGSLSFLNGYTSNTVSSPEWIIWLQYISPFYWAFQSIVVQIYGEEGRELFGLNGEWSVWTGVLVNLVIGLIFKCLQYLALKHLNQLVK